MPDLPVTKVYPVKVKALEARKKVYSWWQHVAFKENGYVFAGAVARLFF